MISSRQRELPTAEISLAESIATWKSSVGGLLPPEIPKLPRIRMNAVPSLANVQSPTFHGVDVSQRRPRLHATIAKASFAVLTQAIPLMPVP
jgi:hypothetical protein